MDQYCIKKRVCLWNACGIAEVVLLNSFDEIRSEEIAPCRWWLRHVLLSIETWLHAVLHHVWHVLHWKLKMLLGKKKSEAETQWKFFKRSKVSCCMKKVEKAMHFSHFWNENVVVWHIQQSSFARILKYTVCIGVNFESTKAGLWLVWDSYWPIERR